MIDKLALKEQIHKELKQYLEEFNGCNSKLKTLSRICIHESGFENWWKFDLGTYLWEFAKSINCRLFIEYGNDRSDILVCTPVGPGTDSAHPNVDKGEYCIPLELKVCLANKKKENFTDEINKLRTKISRPFAIFGIFITQFDNKEYDINNAINYYNELLGKAWFNESVDVASKFFPAKSIWEKAEPKAQLMFWIFDGGNQIIQKESGPGGG